MFLKDPHFLRLFLLEHAQVIASHRDDRAEGTMNFMAIFMLINGDYCD